MVSRVSLKGLYGRIRLQGLYGKLVSKVCPGGTKYSAVDSPGGPRFWGDR